MCAESAARSAFRDIPARSPSVAIADQARSHGSGSHQVDSHDPVAGGRDSAAVAMLTTGGSCANFVIGVTQGEGLRVYLRRAKLARPYIWRLIILILLALPSMAPEWQGRGSPAVTASWSRRMPA